MADYNMAIPEGSTIGQPAAQPPAGGASSASPQYGMAIPEGATIGEAPPQTPMQRAQANAEAQRQAAVNSHDMGAAPPTMMQTAGQHLRDIGNTAVDLGTGAVKQISEMGLTAAQLASKVPGVHQVMQHVPGLNDEALKAVDKSGALSPDNNAQRVGYGGATLLSFLLGSGEAEGGIEATSAGVANSAKVMRVLEGNQKLLQAVKTGANLMQDASKLGPAEKAVVEAHPWLARFVPVAKQAVAAGTTAGAGTAATTMAQHQAAPGEEGTVAELGKSAAAGIKEGASEGVKTGLLTAGIGGGIAGVGGLASKVAGGVEKTGAAVKGAAETVQNATKVGESAPASQSIADDLKNSLFHSKEQMSDDFVSKIDKVAADVPNTVPLHETPTFQMSQELLNAEKPGNKPLLGQSIAGIKKLPEAARDLLKPIARAADIAAEDPAAAEQVSVKDLINYRQQIREVAKDVDTRSPEGKIYKKMMDSVDDTIQDMADKSGNPQAAADYKQARADYKEQVHRFDNTDVQKYMEGDKGKSSVLSNVMDRMMRGEEAASDIRTLRATVGDNVVNKMSDNLLHREMANATTNGVLDPAKAIKVIEKRPKAAMAELFKDTPVDLKQVGLKLETAPEGGTSPLTTSTLTNKAGDTVGKFATTTPKFDPNGTQIKGVFLTDELKGKGIGKSVYEQLIQQAKAEGKTALYSDSSVEPEAQHIWESLAKRYNVTKVDSPEGKVSKLDLTSPRQTPLDKFIGETKNARAVQTLTKAGLLSGGGVAGLAAGAVGGHLLIGLLGPMFEVATAMGGATGGVAGAKQLLEYVANNPRTWNILKNVGSAAETTGRVAGKAANAVSKVAPKVVGAETGTRNKQNLMSDLASSLGGNE